MSSRNDYEHHNKHYECDECGQHFFRLGHLYDHVRVTKHMSVHCLHCGSDITTWKDRLHHFAHTRHSLVDGPIFSAELKNGPCNLELVEPVSGGKDCSDSDEEDFKEHLLPSGNWDDEKDVLIGILLAFRPNGTITLKGLQKVLGLSYMSGMLQRIMETDGSIENFFKRNEELFQRVSDNKLRLKKPREDTIRTLVVLSSVPQALDISLDNLDSNVQFWTQEVFTQPVVYKSGHKDQSKENSGFAAPVVGNAVDGSPLGHGKRPLQLTPKPKSTTPPEYNCHARPAQTPVIEQLDKLLGQPSSPAALPQHLDDRSLISGNGNLGLPWRLDLPSTTAKSSPTNVHKQEPPPRSACDSLPSDSESPEGSLGYVCDEASLSDGPLVFDTQLLTGDLDNDDWLRNLPDLWKQMV
jgi:DNA-directed RNA polymerase subunit RPC12/RpoP